MTNTGPKIASAHSLPRVTVVTVVLDAVDIIERTLRSVVLQDYPNLEYIVIDGLSTDGTLEVIDKYRERIATLVSGKDGGIYPAMNKGADLATGEWILFMNAGDVFMEDNVISKSFVGDTWRDCDVIYGSSVYVYEGLRWLERAPEHATMHDGIGFSHQSVFVRTTLQREYGFDATERVAADYDFFLRLYKAGRRFRRVDVVISEFQTGGFSALPPADTLRLQHRVYKKHLPRSDLVLYARLSRLAAKRTLKALLPTKVWEELKRFRNRGRAAPSGIRQVSR